jgi:hypothetical protein
MRRKQSLADVRRDDGVESLPLEVEGTPIPCLVCHARSAAVPAASRLTYSSLSPVEFLAQFCVIEHDAARDLAEDISLRRICSECLRVVSECDHMHHLLEDGLESLRRKVLNKPVGNGVTIKKDLLQSMVRSFKFCTPLSS